MAAAPPRHSDPLAAPYCRKCGYALRALPSNVCPECGRSFDLTDPATFDTLDGRARRRRRVVRRAFGLLLIASATYALAPRHILTGSATLTCPDCGDRWIAKRWELQAPGWISLRYPGYSWTVHEAAGQGMDETGSICACVYEIAVETQTNTGPPGSKVAFHSVDAASVNDVPVSRENGGRILKALMSRSLPYVKVGPPRTGEQPRGAFFLDISPPKTAPPAKPTAGP